MAKVFYIPNGPKNLSALFPSVIFENVARYYIQVKDADDIIVATTTINELAGCCDDDKVRIHFLNAAGAIDAINFKMVQREHETNSDTFEKPLQASSVKPDHNTGRFNVKSNNIYSVITPDYEEKDMQWIEEILDAPLAWIQWTGIQGQADSFLPIIISDSKIVTKKMDDRHTYQLQLEYRLSHDKFSIRN